MRNAAIDPHFEYLATTGCDGMLKLTKISGSEQALVKSVKVHKKGSVSLQSNQWLGLAWHPSSERLFVAGDNQLGMLTSADNFGDLHTVAAVSHSKEISHVTVVSASCLVTAGLDRMVKVWHTSFDAAQDESSGMKATLMA